MENPTYSSPLDFANAASSPREVSPAAVGMRIAGVHHIVELFNRFLIEGWHPGAQLVVLRHGQVVVDRAAGLADVRRRTAVMPDTPFMTFSVTKAFTGMCVHRLLEEGCLEWDAPIARYWPEFGCKGKERATLRHALLHQAGIPLGGLYGELVRCWNWDWLSHYVAGLPLEFEPGTRCQYHLVNYGFILGETVRRVCGQRIDHFMRRSFFEPLGMHNSYLGLPRAELPRAARLYCGAAQQRQAVNAFNLPWVRGAVIPAASLNSTAREIATFYQMLLNGGQYAGKRLVRAETIAAATRVGYAGLDAGWGTPVRWAHGFHLGGGWKDYPATPAGMGKGSSERTFGHFGQASCMAWADPDADVAVAFTCNRLLDEARVQDRWRLLSDAIWDALD